MPGPLTTADVERALAFQAFTRAACSDTVHELPFGRVIATPSLPLVYSLNAVEVLVADTSVEEAEAELPEVPRPGILVVAEEDHDRFRSALNDCDVDDELTMVLDRVPDAPPADRVREGTREEIAALQRRWLTEDFASQGPEAIDQLMGYMERQWVAHGTRAFVSPAAESMALLWSDGVTANVEDVYTSPDARGNGHARALVSHTAALAASEGHETVFLVADAGDTPQQLYERLGFAPAARALRFTRIPDAED